MRYIETLNVTLRLSSVCCGYEFAKFKVHNDKRSKTSFSYIRQPAAHRWANWLRDKDTKNNCYAMVFEVFFSVLPVFFDLIVISCCWNPLFFQCFRHQTSCLSAKFSHERFCVNLGGNSRSVFAPQHIWVCPCHLDSWLVIQIPFLFLLFIKQKCRLIYTIIVYQNHFINQRVR